MVEGHRAQLVNRNLIFLLVSPFRTKPSVTAGLPMGSSIMSLILMDIAGLAHKHITKPIPCHAPNPYFHYPPTSVNGALRR